MRNSKAWLVKNSNYEPTTDFGYRLRIVGGKHDSLADDDVLKRSGNKALSVNSSPTPKEKDNNHKKAIFNPKGLS